MPITVQPVAPVGLAYPVPFLGDTDATLAIDINLTELTAAELDANGVLKPGIPLRKDGHLLANAGDVVYGVTYEALKVAPSNSATDVAAAGTNGVVQAAVVIRGALKQHVAEDVLGRPFTALELAGFTQPGCHVALVG